MAKKTLRKKLLRKKLLRRTLKRRSLKRSKRTMKHRNTLKRSRNIRKIKRIKRIIKKKYLRGGEPTESEYVSAQRYSFDGLKVKKNQEAWRGSGLLYDLSFVVTTTGEATQNFLYTIHNLSYSEMKELKFDKNASDEYVTNPSFPSIILWGNHSDKNLRKRNADLEAFFNEHMNYSVKEQIIKAIENGKLGDTRVYRAFAHPQNVSRKHPGIIFDYIMRLTVFRSTDMNILNTENTNSDRCVFLVELLNSEDDSISTTHKIELWNNKDNFLELVKAQQIPVEGQSGTSSISTWDLIIGGLFMTGQAIYGALTRGGGPKGRTKKRPCPEVMKYTRGSKNITIRAEYQEKVFTFLKSLISDRTTSSWGNIERIVRKNHNGHFNNPYYTIYDDEAIKSSIIAEAINILNVIPRNTLNTTIEASHLNYKDGSYKLLISLNTKCLTNGDSGPNMFGLNTRYEYHVFKLTNMKTDSHMFRSNHYYHTDPNQRYAFRLSSPSEHRLSVYRLGLKGNVETETPVKSDLELGQHWFICLEGELGYYHFPNGSFIYNFPS